MTDPSYSWLTPDKISTIRSHVMNTMEPLDRAELKCDDAELVVPEIQHAAKLVLFACDLLEARLAAKDGEVVNIPKDQRKDLADSIHRLIEEHENIWLKRNRIGGLSDSSGELDELLKLIGSS